MAEYSEVISPLPYLGNIGFYQRLVQRDVLIDTHEHYVKQSLRNRCELVDSQGRFSLTAPVNRPSGQKILMKEIEIHHESNWRDTHRKAVRSAYGSSPFFIHYWDELATLWDAKPDTLLELNILAHNILSSLVDIEPALHFSEEYITSTPGEDLRKLFKQGSQANEAYTQVFHPKVPFESDLSLIDLIFCIGPESKEYLQRQGS